MSVAVPEAAEVMVTGLVEPKLRVGGYWAPVGLEVIDAASATAALPVKLLDGATVMMEALPVVAPAVTVTAAPATVKTGVMAETVRATEAVAVV